MRFVLCYIREKKEEEMDTEETHMLTAELYLDLSLYSSTVHPAGYIHCVSPDVILRPPGSNHSCHHRAHVDTCVNINNAGNAWVIDTYVRVLFLMRNSLFFFYIFLL